MCYTRLHLSPVSQPNCAGALAHVLRLAEVSQQALSSLTAISQFGYAWGLLEPHIPRLQALVSVMCTLTPHFAGLLL